MLGTCVKKILLDFTGDDDMRTIIASLLTLILLVATLGTSNVSLASFDISSSQAEETILSTPQPDRVREYVKLLSAEPHAIGSAASKRNAEWIRDRFHEWGLDASIEEFDVLFPTPKERIVELTAPTTYRARLKEPVIPEDPDSGDAGQLPTYNAYSGDGDVTAQLVYVNYGIPADYEQLTKLGIDVRGKIVIARYGQSWRGIKPKVAYEHGAVGCLIYSDPRDDGYYQGDVFPQGPYRPEQGVQRGSVMDMPIHPGDPLTPGWGATKGAKRLSREEAKTILKIPVLPISYGDALPLLKALKGPVVPEAWRGALPLTYHAGPGPATVHLKVEAEWKTHTLYNAIGKIKGTVYPDEWVIRGNHHDAWVNGASDPVSGMAAVLEEARSFGELLKKGWRPKRTMIFAAWDGEEPGLLGSTEWAEQHADELAEKAVAYINSDSNGKGQMGAGGSHSLERFINDIARSVNKDGKSIYEGMRARRTQSASSNRPDIRIGALGSGSDYTVFIDHLGIASLNLGFGGEGGGGVYHSIYDSFAWYTRFSDTNFENGRALAQVAGLAMLRLTDAEVLPFEFTNAADAINGYVEEIDKMQKENVDLKPLKAAVEKLKASAEGYAKAGAATDKKALNRMLIQSERKLLSDAGLPRRPWFRHQIYAPGFYTGYGVKTIPGVREAIEQKNWAEANAQVLVAAKTIEAFAANIDAAAKR